MEFNLRCHATGLSKLEQMYGKEIASNISGCSNGRVTNAKGLNRYTELFGDFERASSPGL
jgi:hypothetical protein